ncbi:MAG: hypothetical protein NZ602_15425 [Thermoguttaceae bacterium]|nr:hypothetical protein [Thermoguttaceae bacterium]MDW8038387.1 hypothetical protein [Thermoguttaceae bacterium]
MKTPESLIGYEVNGRYRLCRYYGRGGDGWLYRAVPSGQAVLGSEFGGLPPEQKEIMVEIIPQLPGPQGIDLEKLKALEPHPHWLQCYEIGQIMLEDGQQAWFIFWEAWQYRLADCRPAAFPASPATASSLKGHLATPSPKELLQMAKQVAKALARFHSMGCAHGDVRPERICSVNNHWKLMPPVLQRSIAEQRKSYTQVSPTHDMVALGQILRQYLGASATSSGGSKLAWLDCPRRCLAADPNQPCTAAELALIDATLPPVLGKLSLEHRKGGYRLQWEGPAEAQVEIYLYQQGRLPQPGELWLREELDFVGRRLNYAGQMWFDIEPEMLQNQSLVIVVATVLGEATRINRVIPLSRREDVYGAQMLLQPDGLLVSWHWPQEAYLAKVVLRQDTFPTGPDDPKQISFHHQLIEGANKNGFAFRKEGQSFHQVRIPWAAWEVPVYAVVYAVYSTTGGWEFASGQTEGARAALQWTTSGDLPSGQLGAIEQGPAKTYRPLPSKYQSERNFRGYG